MFSVPSQSGEKLGKICENLWSDLLSNSPKRSPRFSSGYEGMKNIFYLFIKIIKNTIHYNHLPCWLSRFTGSGLTLLVTFTIGGGATGVGVIPWEGGSLLIDEPRAADWLVVSVIITQSFVAVVTWRWDKKYAFVTNLSDI